MTAALVGASALLLTFALGRLLDWGSRPSRMRRALRSEIDIARDLPEGSAARARLLERVEEQTVAYLTYLEDPVTQTRILPGLTRKQRRRFLVWFTIVFLVPVALNFAFFGENPTGAAATWSSWTLGACGVAVGLFLPALQSGMRRQNRGQVVQGGP